MIEQWQAIYSPETECAVALWQPGDVQHAAKRKGVKLTEEEISEVLSNIQRKQDCEIGINWGVIDCWIDEIISQR